MVATSEDLPEKAIEYNLRTIDLEPGNVDAWHNMRLTYLLTSRPKEAIRCFEKALSLEDRADTRRFLDQAYESMTD
jgi:tetratricopeptide (TPR) repeat protein